MSNAITQKLKNIEGGVRKYASTQYPAMAGKKALRFIDDNFRNQSWEGTPWKRRRALQKGKIRALLILTGKLRRGNRMQVSPGAVRLFNEVRYAKAHNEGFRGTVNVPAHARRLSGRFKASSIATRSTRLVKTHKANTEVKAHTMRMNIPRRQFFPTAARPSPTLTNAIKKQVTLDVYKIMKFS